MGSIENELLEFVQNVFVNIYPKRTENDDVSTIYNKTKAIEATRVTNIPKSIILLEKLEDLNVIIDSEESFKHIMELKSLKRLSITFLGSSDNLQSLLVELFSKLSLESFSFSSRMKRIPDVIGEQKGLKSLVLEIFDLEYLPNNIFSLKKLEILKIQPIETSKAIIIPSSIENLKRLKTLDIATCDNFPDSISRLNNLETLHLCSSTLINEEGESNERSDDYKDLLKRTVLPLKKLRELSFDSVGMKTLPNWLGSLQNLESFSTIGGMFKTIPEILRKLNKLKYLRLEACEIETIPEWLGELEIESLNLNENNLINISNLKHLNSLEVIFLAMTPVDYKKAKSLVPEKCTVLSYTTLTE